MFEVSLILVCILLNGVLACSEAAFIASDKFVLKGLAEKGSKEGSVLLDLKKRPERVLAIIQVGITFVGAFAAAIGGAGAQEFLTPWMIESLNISKYYAEVLATLVVVAPLTYLSVVFGELVPKTIALRRPISISTKFAYFFSFIGKFLTPIVWIFEWSTKKVVSLLFSHLGTKTGFPELEDVVSEQGKEYIINMFKIEKSTIRHAVIKWENVDSISRDLDIDEVEKAFILSGHTRLPVIGEGKIVGILNSKEFFAYRKTEADDWRSLMRGPVSVSENTYFLEALKLLREKSAHMAVVLNGEELVGIITIEDILEEIVGDIYDEDDYGSIENILSNTRYRG